MLGGIHVSDEKYYKLHPLKVWVHSGLGPAVLP